MKIALVAPPFGQTGGPEVVVNNLANALVDKGVDVTLFAPADWETSVRLIPTLPVSLWNMKDFSNQTEKFRKKLIVQSQITVLDYQEDFDIIHLNSQRNAFLVGEKSQKPCLLTLHNRVKDFEIYKRTKDAGVFTVAISEGRRNLQIVDAVVQNGISIGNITPSFASEDYFIAIGRLTTTKGIHKAIGIVSKAGGKLLIFGRIGNSEERQKYFQEKIKPYLSEQIVYMGEASQEMIFEYLKKAKALISPIEEPGSEILLNCPLIIMESLSCGTPVIGTPVLSLLETGKNREIGFFSGNIDQLVEAAKNTKEFDRRACRRFAENEFDSLIMAEKYIALYKQMIEKMFINS